MVRVLVVDDSATVRQYLTYLLGEAPDLDVVGTATDGDQAVEQAERLRPDAIVMDVHMPRMNGYEATRRIMERAPTPIVMVSTAARREEVAMTFDALKAGAVTVLEKPAGLDDPDHAESALRLVEAVRLMAQVKVVRRWPRREWTVVRPAASAEPGRRVRVVAIGASTGGPQVLAEILARQPRDFPAPILIVQHISAGFTAGLAHWLGLGTRLTVTVPAAGDRARAGTAYLAPDGVQMGISSEGRIELSAARGEHDFCPSASYLFESVARSYGRAAMGILLTGMGRDGAAGLMTLRRTGGVSVAQDRESSVIFGMPAEAVRLGAAQYVLSPEEIAAMMRTLAAAG